MLLMQRCVGCGLLLVWCAQWQARGEEFIPQSTHQSLLRHWLNAFCCQAGEGADSEDSAEQEPMIDSNSKREAGDDDDDDGSN